MRLLAPLFTALLLCVSRPATGSASDDLVRPLLPSIFHALSQAQDVPEDWQGVWDTSATIRDCTTNAILGTTTSRDTTCATDSFNPDDEEGILYDCITEINATTVILDCNASYQVVEGCTANLDYNVTTTRTGTSYTATGTINTTYTGVNCGPLPNTCVKIEITGTRVASGAGICSTPVEPTTWGRIKSQYD